MQRFLFYVCIESNKLKKMKNMQQMKNLMKLGVLALTMALSFASCNKENKDEIITNYSPDTVQVNSMIKRMQTFSADTLYISCVAIPYPIEFKQVSGKKLTVKDSTDFNAARSNGDSIIDFVYPFDAVVKGNPTTINDVEGLMNAIVFCDSKIVTCDDLDAHMLLFYKALNIFTTNKYVFTINYPVQVIVNGKTITLYDNDDYIPAIGGNPSRPEKATLVYPISIKQFGQTITLNNDQDVCDFHSTLSENCANKPAHIQFFFNEGGGTPINCAYYITYPVQADYKGNRYTFKNRDAYTSFLNNDPDVYKGLTLVYPVEATKFKNGQVLTFNANSDICQYLDNCK